MCACVTGVQRGPARGTEFKFQIWSVSQGVTVCIALPAGSNSLHRWCVFDPSALLCPASLVLVALCARSPFPLFPNPPSTYPVVPLIPSIYLSISIFHIIQTREESDLIDRRKESPFIKRSQLKCGVYTVSYVNCTFLRARVFESICGRPRFNTNLFRYHLRSKLIRRGIPMSHLLKVRRNRVTDADLRLNGLTSIKYGGVVISWRQISNCSRNL